MKTKVIFFGNGLLSDCVLYVLEQSCDIIFHARTKEDLETVKQIRQENPEAHGVLASFGVLIKPDVLELFEPEGILNIHPSSLPKYRGPSPIETAIINGDTEFGVSIMKLVKEMDAGPIYYQTSFEFTEEATKQEIYEKLGFTGAKWIAGHLGSLTTPVEQSGEPTYTKKFTSSDSALHPESQTAEQMYNQVRAFAKSPKTKYSFYGLDCTILEAIITDVEMPLSIKGVDGHFLSVLFLQPDSRKPMDAKSFINGYKNRK